MEKYEELEAEVLHFEEADIITASVPTKTEDDVW